MSQPSALPDSAESPPTDLPEAGTYRSASVAFEHALVVLAAGRNCWIVPDGSAHRLLVEADALSLAREQLARYDRESSAWPPAEPAVAARARFDWSVSLIWTGLVLAAYWAQGRWPGLANLGALDSERLVDRAEIWRPATALFLHANADHVLANLLTGIFIFPLVLSTLGRLRGFLLLLLAATAANTAIALFAYPGPYRSLGGSTAIFAALGLLTGHAIRAVAQPARHPRWRTLFLPLAGGLTTLALFGAGAPNVDLGAHVTGFLFGVILGAVCSARG